MRLVRGKPTLGILTTMLRKSGKDVSFRGVVFERWGFGILTMAPMSDLSRDAFGNRPNPRSEA